MTISETHRKRRRRRRRRGRQHPRAVEVAHDDDDDDEEEEEEETSLVATTERIDRCSGSILSRVAFDARTRLLYERVQNDDERERGLKTPKKMHTTFFSPKGGKGASASVLRFRVNNNECYYNFTLSFLSFFLSLSLSLSLSKREMKICKKELKEILS